MSDVQFENENYTSPSHFKKPSPKGITGLLIKAGLAKNDNQANLILIMIIAISLLFVYLSLKSRGSNTPPPAPPPTYEELHLKPNN